jgi:hypothetical protein
MINIKITDFKNKYDFLDRINYTQNFFIPNGGKDDKGKQ